MQLSTDTAEELIVPTVRTIENDLFPGAAASQTKSRIYEQMRELIEELTVPAPGDADERGKPLAPQDLGLVIVPLVGEGDEVVGKVLARLLEARGIGSRLLPWRTLRSEKVETLKELDAKCIVLSAIESRAQVAVGNLTRSIQSLLPNAMIAIGLWSLPPAGAARLIRRIRESSAHHIYTNLDEAVQGVFSLAFPAGSEPHPDPVPH
jgi:hypothetical protein